MLPRAPDNFYVQPNESINMHKKIDRRKRSTNTVVVHNYITGSITRPVMFVHSLFVAVCPCPCIQTEHALTLISSGIGNRHKT